MENKYHFHFRNSRKPRIKNAKIKCEVLDRTVGKIMVTNKSGEDRILHVSTSDLGENFVKITLVLNPDGIWAIFRTNETYRPFEIRDGDLLSVNGKKFN